VPTRPIAGIGSIEFIRRVMRRAIAFIASYTFTGVISGISTLIARGYMFLSGRAANYHRQHIVLI